MSRNLGYTRKFIILRKEYSTIGHLNPKGHGRLEIKGLKAMISLNLENAQSDSYYQVVLVGSKNNYSLGKIYVEDNNKGYEEFYINAKELEEKDFSLEKINGILIVNDKDILLGGYFYNSDNSIERYIATAKKLEDSKNVSIIEEDIPAIVEEIIEAEEQVVEVVEFIEEVFEEPQELVEEVIAEEVIVEEAQEVVAKEEIIEELAVLAEDEPLVWEELFRPINEELDITNVEPTIEEVFIAALEDLFRPEAEEVATDKVEPYIEPIIEEIDYDQFDNQNKIIQKNQTTGYILNILRYFPYTDPFKKDLKGYNWWKINTEDPNEEKGFLPYFSYVTGGDHKYPIIENATTANELMRKNKHYLFGLYNFKDDVKFYVYGIPGDFIAEDHPQKGLTGFNTWYEDKNNKGYWLLYIDPLTGRIIYPINPMIPID